MKDLISSLVSVFQDTGRINYRDRRGHYASSNLTCLRDQFWMWNNEPETNPTDLKGSMKMMVGNAIEDGIVKHLLSKLHFIGFHLIGTQIPVGGSNPNWNGYLDALMARKTDTGWDKFVVEIKTKSGYGADLFARNPAPDAGYMTQLGLYLKDLHEKGVTNHGCFLYVLLSDKNFGELIAVNCQYDPNTTTVTATDFVASDGRSGALNVSQDLGAALERWKKLDKHLSEGVEPEGEYQYKYPLTPELLRDIPDAKLKKIIEGTLVFGDWQPLYSRFKNKQLLVDGIVPERTEEEKAMVRAEYKRRHPRSKI